MDWKPVDGTFYMSWEDIIKYFDTFTICKNIPINADQMRLLRLSDISITTSDFDRIKIKK